MSFLTENTAIFNADEALHTEGRYEDVYGHYLKFFEKLACIDWRNRIIVDNCPAAWVPLVMALGGIIMQTTYPRECDHMAKSSSTDFFNRYNAMLLNDKRTPADLSELRTLLDTLVGFSPETTDALWKCTAQWDYARLKMQPLFRTRAKSFTVTSNGSFHRNEIREYYWILQKYDPKLIGLEPKPNLVIVPCAADKPYPSKLHQTVIDMLPDQTWDIANATGVLGIVPRELWGLMPYYDSAIPNEWRLMNTAAWFFRQHKSFYRRIVVYADYYSIALLRAFEMIDRRGVMFVNPIKFYADYLDLLDEKRLAALNDVLRCERNYTTLNKPLVYVNNAGIDKFRDAYTVPKESIEFLFAE